MCRIISGNSGMKLSSPLRTDSSYKPGPDENYEDVGISGQDPLLDLNGKNQHGNIVELLICENNNLKTKSEVTVVSEDNCEISLETKEEEVEDTMNNVCDETQIISLVNNQDIPVDTETINHCKTTEEQLQQEHSDLKQVIIKLESELSMKDEEIKLLKEQMKKNSNMNEKNVIDLEEFRKIMEEYEKSIAAKVGDNKKLKKENDTVTRHLADLELSFSDLHQKYERSKTIIQGYKSNAEQWKEKFSEFEEVFRKQEQKYESSKAHATATLEKAKIEIMQRREKFEDDVTKLKAIKKRLEIKISATEKSLELKTQECAALAALYDEITGKKV